MAGNRIDEVLTERGSKYGPFSGHASATMDIKRMAHRRLTDNVNFIAMDDVSRDVVLEALDMIAHKIGRIVNGDPMYDDSWRDIAGYATLVEKHINGERK
jgi:hypothetical protein